MPSLPDRPKALTDEKQKIILDAIKLGMHFRPACELAEIESKSVKYWMKLCEDGAEHAQIYADFFRNIKKAIALAEGQSLATLKTGSPGWQAQAWFLERRFPDRWRMKKDDAVVPPPPKQVVEVRLVDASVADADIDDSAD